MDSLNKEQKKILSFIAKDAIDNFIKDHSRKEYSIQDKRLLAKGGAFVTIHQKNKLRGCIGQIFPANYPLWMVIRDMAIEAAFNDPRFNPLSKKEFEEIEIEISVLSIPEKISDWRKIELGKHGVIVRRGNNCGVFLPQVAVETGWGLEEFLSQLCSGKACLNQDCYLDPKTEISIFTADIFKVA